MTTIPISIQLAAVPIRGKTLLLYYDDDDHRSDNNKDSDDHHQSIDRLKFISKHLLN